MQTTSPAKMYESSTVFKELITMSIKNHNGTRVGFVIDFFDKIRVLNNFLEADEHMDYVTIRGLLATTVNSNKDLPGIFSDCNPTRVRAVKVEALNMQMHDFQSLPLR